ncbi:MAG: DUF2279 domain-containing protein, partial [Spirochaetota bacterium]
TKKSVIRWGILGGTIPVTFFFGVKAWDWNGNHDPFTEKEGWFQQSTSYGGQDKAGHFIAHYMAQRSLYNVFDYTEDGGNRKFLYSLGTTLALGLFIEVGDSMSAAYGFSYEDLVMDYSGALLGAMLDRFPVMDGFFGFSTQYIPTRQYYEKYAKKHNPALTLLNSVNDYSGYKTMINFKFDGFRRIGFDIPLALQLLQFDIGYYTKGFSQYDDNRDVQSNKKRYLCAGISLNAARILDLSWQKNRNGFYTASHRALEFYHIPGYITSYQLSQERRGF